MSGDGGRRGDVPAPTSGPPGKEYAGSRYPATGDGTGGGSTVDHSGREAARLVPFTVGLVGGGEVELVRWVYGPNGETRLEDRNLLDADGNRYRLVGGKAELV